MRRRRRERGGDDDCVWQKTFKRFCSSLQGTKRGAVFFSIEIACGNERSRILNRSDITYPFPLQTYRQHLNPTFFPLPRSSIRKKNQYKHLRPICRYLSRPSKASITFFSLSSQKNFPLDIVYVVPTLSQVGSRPRPSQTEGLGNNIAAVDAENVVPAGL